MKIQVTVTDRTQRFQIGQKFPIKLGPYDGTFYVSGVHVLTEYPGEPRRWFYTLRLDGVVNVEKAEVPEDRYFLEALELCALLGIDGGVIEDEGLPTHGERRAAVIAGVLRVASKR